MSDLCVRLQNILYINKSIMYRYMGMRIKKSLNYQLTISTIIGVVFFLMSANFAFGHGFGLYLVQHFRKKNRNKENPNTLKN